MRIAIGQVPAGVDKTENLERVGRMIAAAGERGAGLIAFPEYTMYKQPVRDDAFLVESEPLDGPFATGVRALAARHGVGVLIGLNERIDEEPRAYNTILFAGPDGRQIGVYRKIHLYDAFGGSESTWIRPGDLDQQLVFDLDDLRIGIMTCYDLRFPEMGRRLIDAGADLIAIPSAWTPGPRKEDHWRTLVRARAIENVAYVAAPGLAPPVCTGGSLIVDPMGVVLAEIGESVDVAYAEVTRDRLAAVWRTNPARDHRRLV